MVALRSAPVLAATAYVAGPVPDPFAVVTVSHDALEVALHAQPVCVDTVTDELAPDDENEADDGDNAYVQPMLPAAWLTETIRPAIVIVPVRAAPLLAASAYDAVPAPLPPNPVIVIHVA